MDFYTAAGQMALGSRLRQLGDVLMNDAEKIYKLYDVDLDPRWFPVFYMLTVKESAGITELAEDIGQTHPAVSQVVKSMISKNIVSTEKCPNDARINRVLLTEHGKNIAQKLAIQCTDVNTVVSNIFNESGSQLWSELDAVDYEIKQKSLYERVIEVRKSREQDSIQLVAYRPEYKKAFKELNVAWIQKHWVMEAADYKALENPTESIINKGGYIVVALHKNVPVGVCAMIKMAGGSFELAKMAVTETAKGLGIGTLLGEHIIAQARAMGAHRVYLESNTVLEPALGLYRKLGFKRVSGYDSPYERCNIQMELNLAS